MNGVSPPSINKAREDLLTIFQAGLAAVNGRHCVAGFLQTWPPARAVSVVALGKAASAMAAGAVDALGERLQRALLVTKPGHVETSLQQDARFTCMEAGHPVPDERSLRSGAALLRFLEDTPDDEDILFLISGGTSSLVEVLPEGVTLEELQRVNQWLLASGLSIADINRIRQSISAIKGGRLARLSAHLQVTVAMISDVAGDDPAIVGSGLLSPPADHPLQRAQLPVWLQALLEKVSPRWPAAADFTRVSLHIIARLDDALQAAAVHARALGYPVNIMEPRLYGDALATGGEIIEVLRQQPAGIYIWGGETTVKLPERPGRGGRNQSLALSAALALVPQDTLVVLAAGTDGTDGPTPAAGAMVDNQTVSRGAACGLVAREYLQHADAGTFLEASGDLITTGPTGTNVTDMVIGLKTG